MIECQEDADRGCGMVIVTFTKSLCCKTVGSLVWQGDIKTVSKPRKNSRYSPVSNLRFPEKTCAAPHDNHCLLVREECRVTSNRNHTELKNI